MYDHLSTAELIIQGRLCETTIRDTKKRLTEIELTLRSRALAMPHEPLANGSREGRRATLRDGDESLTVLFESDVLKSSFAADSDLAFQLGNIISIAEMTALFKLKSTYERRISDGHKFRLECIDKLRIVHTPETAATVIDLLKDRDKNGIVKSKSVIEWD
jgi:hypothetical protein